MPNLELMPGYPSSNVQMSIDQHTIYLMAKYLMHPKLSDDFTKETASMFQ